ncbi:protein kinase family protein [Lysobacter sp. CCNWLW3]|uniref:protein kinase family protein n=1 Tax=unclassified Lysobacter TaxID=2635362 RepID=UPI002FD04EE1
MAYPTLEQYNLALASPQLTLRDAELRGGTVRTTSLGVPRALCGGFALTYTIDTPGKRYALRCFHKEAPELEKRYRLISDRIKQLNSPFFLPFDFQSDGIVIDKRPYPVVKMAWAAGETLSEFLDTHHATPTTLSKLRQSLTQLSAYLEGQKIAHGDIQPGNVMVGAQGASLQLIDYDGMFVEAFRGSRATELGQLNFQHPARSASYFNETLDRFSFLALDVALQALIAQPGIWRTSRSDPDAVVFRRNDYLDPGSSPVFAQLLKLPAVAGEARKLAQVASAPIDQTPSLAEFLQGKGVPQIVVAFGAAPSAAQRAYQGAYTVCDALSFSQVQAQVGNRIELIGRIVAVDRQYTKRSKKPYLFVNFSNWQDGPSVKLNIWTDGLDALGASVPTKDWIGKWVSVTGLVDPVYNGMARSGSYSSVSVTVSQRGQIQIIEEAEAKFRLRGGSDPSRTAGPRNTQVLGNMGIRPETPRSAPSSVPARSASVPPTRPAPPPAPKSANSQVLDRMRGQTSSPHTPSPHGVLPHRPQTKPPAPEGGLGVFGWIVVGLMVLVALRSCL